MLAHHIGHFDLGAVDNQWSRAVGSVMSSGIRWHDAIRRRVEEWRVVVAC